MAAYRNDSEKEDFRDGIKLNLQQFWIVFITNPSQVKILSDDSEERIEFTERFQLNLKQVELFPSFYSNLITSININIKLEGYFPSRSTLSETIRSKKKVEMNFTQTFLIFQLSTFFSPLSVLLARVLATRVHSTIFLLFKEKTPAIEGKVDGSGMMTIGT